MIALQLETIGIVLILSMLLLEEIHRVKKFITPFTLLVLPFIVIFLISNLILIHYHFPYISERVLFFLSAQMFVFWVLGRIILSFFPEGTLKRPLNFSALEQFYSQYTLFFIFIGLVSAYIIFAKAISLFNAHGGFSYFAHSDYEKFMTRGWQAHFIQVAKVSFFFMVVAFRRSNYKKLIFISFIILFLAIAIVQIKYHILHIVFITLIYFTLNKDIKKQIRSMAASALALIVLFNLFWVFIALAGGIFDINIIFKIILKYMANYLASGSMILEKWMQHSSIRPDWAAFVTFKNIFNAIVGNPLRYNTVHAFSLDFMYVAPGVFSNISTAYGPLFILGGWPFAWAYTVVIGVLSHLFFYLSYWKQNIFALFINLLFFVFVLFTFFGIYFFSPSTYEMPVILIIIAGGLRSWAYIKELIFKKYSKIYMVKD